MTTQLDQNDPLGKFFPFPEYRPYQRETIVEIAQAFRDGKDNVILEAPVGSGKSVVAVALANILQTAYFITSSKILQSQYINDFEHIVELKGRNAYPCWFMNDYQKANKYFGADKGKCVQKGKSFLDMCVGKGRCSYKNQVDLATSSPQVMFNFSSFLFQRNMAGRFKNSKKLLVIDECQNTEMQIMNFVEVVIKGDDIDTKLPSLGSVDLYMGFFKSINIEMVIAEKASFTRSQALALCGSDESEIVNLSKEDAEFVIKNMKLADRYDNMLLRYRRLVEDVNNVKCVCDFDAKNNSVSIKPLYANYHTPKLLLTGGENRLLMSATILNPKVYGESIGLDMSKTHYISVPHTFPRNNRLIHLDYAGPMDYKSRSDTMPIMIDKVDKLMSKHGNEKGIIHCQSFKLMKDISDGLSAKNKGRLLNQTMFRNKDELLDAHSVSNNTVIIAPAMHEGLDLKNDLSRFQIVAKIPYPDSRGNKQLEIRTKENWNYYLWLTALKLVQSTGRSVRSETDYASTYILDASFDKFFNMADRAKLLPNWFVESLVVEE